MCCRLTAATIMCLCCATGPSSASPPKPPSVALKMKLSKPFTHANLTVFLIHGPDACGGKKVVTLKEAMEQKLAVVHETSNVNLLSVENLSPDVEIFIMAGDVVKGGKQDRVIAFDLIVPSKSGKVGLPSFCVEAGRWRQRGAEAAGQFACSDNQICNRALKVAVNESRQQGEVWKEVANTQQKLSANVGKNVQPAASPSSLQLTLEDKDVQAKITEYIKSLENVSRDFKDVIGVAFAVNGIVVGADVFGSAELLQKLWPKLLRSAATEALSELKTDKKCEECNAAAVEVFLSEASKGEAKELQIAASQAESQQRLQNNVVEQNRQANQNEREPQPAPSTSTTKARVRIIQYINPKTLLVESHDRDKPDLVWHRCYVAK